MDFILIVALLVTLVGAVFGALFKFASGPKKSGEGKMSSKDKKKVTTYDLADDTASETTLLEDLVVLSDNALGAGLSPRRSPAKKILVVFVLFVLGLGILTVWRYMDSILANTDALLFGLWLFLTMVAGMFVQVLSSNYRQGKRLFNVRASQLVFPLLFSIVVFYPVWAIGASAEVNLFSFHAAFLNGYFWESVVSSATLPQSK